MKVALVAFRGTVGQEVMIATLGAAHFVVGSSVQQISTLCQSGKLEAYDFLIGLGVYTGAGLDFVHVEQECVDADGHKRALDVSLVGASTLFKQSKTIKKSWCNMLAAQLVQKYPHKRVAFLHVPAKLNVQIVAEQLSSTFTG